MGINFVILLLITFAITLFLLNRNSYYPYNETLVVSLTTSPTRIGQIKPMLDSVMAQTYKPDRIILNLPKVFGRTGDMFALPLPDFITNNPLIQVNFCDDIGPATKIISSLPLVSNPNTYIISVDDDTYYPPYLFGLYMKYTRLFPDCIITGSTFIENTDRLERRWFRNIVNQKIPRFTGKLADLLEGFSGVLYRRDYFSQELLSDFYKHLNVKSCRLGDDFYLSNLFKKWRRKIVSLDIQHTYENFNPNWISQFKYGFNEDALHKHQDSNYQVDTTYQVPDGNSNNYRNCTKILDENDDLYIDYFQK
jgi:hypothetical protein